MNSYTFHINLYDLAALGTIFVGLTFALLLWFTKSVNRSANRFLALALATMVLWMIRVLGMDMRLENYLPGWDRLPMQFLLAMGPMICFYVLKITRPEFKFTRRHLLHFSPLLLEQTVLVLEIKESIRTGAATYVTNTFQVLNPVLQLLIFISIMTYLYKSHQLIQHFYRRLQPVLMDRSLLEFRWLRRLLAATALLWTLWIAYAAVDYFGYRNQLGTHVYYTFYIFLAVIIIWTSMAAFLRPQAALIVQQSTPLRSSPTGESKSKGIWLKRAMEANLYYQDPELTLSSLAGKLDLHTHELSRILNTVLKKSFNDFVNEYRVRDVAAKMQDPAYDHITFLGIAYEAGFNSQSTFTRVFKQMTGQSPMEYKNNLKKDCSTYKLGIHPQFAPVISNRDAIPKWSPSKSNRGTMFKNYLKIAFRNFWKHKVFTLINIVGLSIGISASLVIYLIVHYDFSFDKFHKDSDRIYRVVSNFKFQGNESHSYGVTTPMAAGIKANVTGVEIVAPLYTLNPDVMVTDKNNAPVKLKGQDHITLADQNYFKIINYTWLAGSPTTALNEPYHVVLTSERAKVYFPSLSYEQMIGKTVTYDTLKTTVSGIVETIKENTDFSAHDFISFSSGNLKNRLGMDMQLDSWGSTNSASEVFIKLNPKASAANVQKQVNALYKKSNPQSAEDLKNASEQTYTVQPLSDIHFNQLYGTFDFSGPASKSKSYMLLAIAGFLLLLGCINFINLTTAQATQRAKEIGIRKTMGSSRPQLIMQFLSETFLITLFAVIISIGLTPLILKLFSGFVAPGVKANFLQQPDIFIFLFVLTVIVSILSGFYPALMLSGYKPVSVLKNQVQSGTHKTRNAWLRKSLTVSQFIIAQFFIMATMLVSKQIYYALHKDLGFKKDAIVYAQTPYKVGKASTNKVMLNKLGALPGVEMVSLGYFPPSSGATNATNALYKDGKKEIITSVEIKYADENYIKLYHIKLLAGRNITAADSTTGVVINEKYARTIGFANPGDAIGKTLEKLNNSKSRRIVGVAGNFYTHSLQSPIGPLVILAPGGNNFFHNSVIHIALKPETPGSLSWSKTMTAMNKIWKEFYPDDDTNYKFYDKSIEQFYDQEKQTSTLLSWATGLSIFISCLGLLGLAIYTTGQRTKEIGIRKVLGASVTEIVRLLSTELISLILLAFVIVTPLAWWAMNKWMESYADKTQISWWIFAASGAGMLLTAFITSSFQTIRAAIVNPVKSLRSE
ncbi:ABC transporter permease [Mucilaginibacter kameinonensis]|uniref:ABC transporter permease n=1 Tax=Mucilaginibacter kameinonensis TaxID=452286 RepID=UPI000EF7850C|nr:ABC transporter permease [Mucilaginibacter kameinonensis]